MKKLHNNKLGYLSAFSLVGFLGLSTEHSSLLWFFCYIGYAYYFSIVPDELFKANLAKASAITLFILLALLSTIIVAGTVMDNNDLFLSGLGLSFLIGNVAFAISHSIYEARESRGAKNEDL